MSNRALLTMMLVSFLVLSLSSNLQASLTQPALPLAGSTSQSITIDGDPSEWGSFTCPTLPLDGNYGVHYYTVLNEIPQWIWCDAGNDERTDFSNPDPRVDLVQFRVTGDGEYLYLLFILNNTSSFNIGDDGGTFIAVAINRNGSVGGELWFAGESDTSVSERASWDYQAVVNLADSRFRGQGRSQLTDSVQSNWGGIFYLVNRNWEFITDSSAQVGVDLLKNSVEIKIPWTVLGGFPSGESFFLRLSLITARGWSDYNAGEGGTWDVNGASDALDVMTTTGPNTWNEVEDGVVDYSADVYFTTTLPYYPVPEPGLLIATGVSLPVTGFIAYELWRKKRSSH